MIHYTHTKAVFIRSRSPRVQSHRLPVCHATGLARYRDRHQALAGARALDHGNRTFKHTTFACPECRGVHLERRPNVTPPMPTATPIDTSQRRYVVFDVENLTWGAQASRQELSELWRLLQESKPALNPADHVVIGASVSVSRKYRGVIEGNHVRWVVGANAPDGADHALLAAIDMYRVVRRCTELVIISGDHAFANLARHAQHMGLKVHVVTGRHPRQRTMLAQELSKAADIHTQISLESFMDLGPQLTLVKKSPKPIPQPATHVQVSA